MKTITISFEDYVELKNELKSLITLLDEEEKEEKKPELKEEEEKPKPKKRGRPKKKKDPEPDPESDPEEEEEYTKSDVKRALNLYAKKNSVEAAYAKLADFKADEVDDLDPEAYGNLIKSLK